MKDSEKGTEQHVDELLELRRKVADMERTEEALRISEAKYRRLHQSMMDAFVSVNMDGLIQEFNEAYCQMLGYEPEELLKLRYTDITPEKWHVFQKEILEKQVLGRGYSDIYEKEYRRKDGTIFPIELRTSLMTDAQGSPCGMWAIIRDIAERKLAEAALQKARNDLERRVEERTAELSAANEQLRCQIEQRKRIEVALRQSRDEFQMIYNEMVEGCVIADIETKRFVRANSSFCQMLGYSEEELMAASVQDIHPPEEVAEDLQRFQQVAESQRSIHENRPVLRKDGTIFYADISGCRIFYNGRTCALALFRDVTERRQAQVALQESEEKYKTLVETLPDAVIMADLAGHATFVSRRLLELHRADSADEFMGKTAWDYLVPEEHEKAYAYYHKTLNEGIVRGAELTFIRMDGTRFPSELSSALVKDASGKAVAIINVLRDITERKVAEQVLRQSEERHRGLLEACPDAVVIADLKGKILFASQQTCELVGLSHPEELVGQSIFDYVIEEDRPRLAANIPSLVQTGVRYHIEYTVLRRQGTSIPTEISSAISRDAAGQPIAIMAVIRDISERKRVEEILQKEHRTLKHLLQSSDHERQTIAYEIHDGLAQQLAGSIMQFQTYDHLKETKPHLGRKAYEAGMTMLQQSHCEARRLIAGIRHPVLDEAGVVEAIAHLINEHNRQKGPKIEFRSLIDFSRLVPLLENAIYRIIQEGLSNACQHSQSSRVRITLLQQKDRIRVEIRDWGIGFDVKNIKEGSYGLTGIRERARLLGGKYRLQTAASKGTRITVELPLMERGE